LELLPHVRMLDLSCNLLPDLDGLGNNCVLSSLDVSHNRLSQWRSAWIHHCCSGLTTLNVSHNCIVERSNLQQLAASVPQLLHLRMLGNPVAHDKAYISALITALPGLQQLDGHSPGALCGGKCDNVLDPEMLQEHSVLWHSEFGALASMRDPACLPHL
jgi:Leucine-rich repeat (LRR) protein